MKKLSEDLWVVLGLFLGWRVLLVIFFLVALRFVPLGSTDKFFGGGIENYSLSPGVFAWANFDGEHYLSLAIFGYKNLEQAFFPLYPKLISILAKPFSFDFYSSLVASTLSGLIISGVSFILALLLLWDLLRLDYSKKIALWTLLLILVFPTSFFFTSLYSESLFLLLTVGSFYSARKKRWVWAGILGMAASVTKVFGILLLPALLIEAYQAKISLKKYLWLLLIPLGLGVYMFYQWQTVSDPLAFYRLQTIVGEQHQPGIVPLPQVFFRYIKILVTLDKTSVIYQTVVLEFISGLLFLSLPIYGFFRKIRLSYLCFALLGLLAPASTGSFSSLPRYVLVLFPGFLALSLLTENWPKSLKYLLLAVFSCWLMIESSLFLRGYWVA